MTDILVTGAAGFIGSHLVPWLAQRHPQWRVYALVRPGSLPAAPAAGVHYVPWDLAAERPLAPHAVWNGDAKAALVDSPLPRGEGPGVRAEPAAVTDKQRLPGHVDAVLHLAQANVPFPAQAAELLAVNVASTQRLLDYARVAGASVFLLASSGSVYGSGGDAGAAPPLAPAVSPGTPAVRPWREDDAPQPDDYYGATKLAAEWLVRSYRVYFHPVILRLFAPYGPGQTGRLIPGLIARVRDGRPVTLSRGARPHFNPLYVADLLPMIERALALPGEQVLNVGGDEVLSIRDMAVTIGSVLGKTPLYARAPGAPPGDAVGDVGRMHALLRPAPLTPFATGVAKTA